MTQYIDKAAVLAEIKKLHGNPFYRMAIKDVLSILDTLEVKEVDLDKEIGLVEDKYYGFESLSRADIIEIIKHFFNLGLKAQKA